MTAVRRDIESSHRHLQSSLERTPPVSKDVIRGTVEGHLANADLLDVVDRGAIRVLDLGCGIGASVSELLVLGYDAWGADVREYWATDYDQYWHAVDRPGPELAARLRRISFDPYRLPFPDGQFDLVVSDHVFEHVLNPVETMCVPLSPVIGTHAGPGTVALNYMAGII